MNVNSGSRKKEHNVASQLINAAVQRINKRMDELTNQQTKIKQKTLNEQDLNIMRTIGMRFCQILS